MVTRLTLIGYRACGKSTAGRLSAQRLGWPFVDADQALEAAAGRSIADIFATEGEAAFRDLEARTLATLLATPGPLVLATGGGCVLREDNRQLLARAGGLVVYLEASAGVLQSRLRADQGGRPSLSGAPVTAEVPRLLALREPLYRACAASVLDAERPAVVVALDLARLVENHGRKPG